MLGCCRLLLKRGLATAARTSPKLVKIHRVPGYADPLSVNLTNGQELKEFLRTHRAGGLMKDNIVTGWAALENGGEYVLSRPEVSVDIYVPEEDGTTTIDRIVFSSTLDIDRYLESRSFVGLIPLHVAAGQKEELIRDMAALEKHLPGPFKLAGGPSSNLRNTTSNLVTHRQRAMEGLEQALTETCVRMLGNGAAAFPSRYLCMYLPGGHKTCVMEVDGGAEKDNELVLLEAKHVVDKDAVADIRTKVSLIHAQVAALEHANSAAERNALRDFQIFLGKKIRAVVGGSVLPSSAEDRAKLAAQSQSAGVGLLLRNGAEYTLGNEQVASLQLEELPYL